MEMTKEIAQKVLDTVDAGLVKGLGKAIPGKMCVEAAVCYAMGMPHSDKPQCVGFAVRDYKIRLNDANWSSDKARAQGMRRVAVAQLGSDQIDQLEFTKEVTLQVTRQLLPRALRAAAKLLPAHAETLEASAVACAAVTKFSEVNAAANAAANATYAANAAANDANAANATYAAAYAANAASYAADAADAADAARAASYATNDAANAATYAARAAANTKDEILTIAAEIGVQALIKLGCKGCDWLVLTESAA